MWDKHNDNECGCGGMCRWDNASKEEKIAILDKKKEKLRKMLAHIEKVKEAVTSGKPIKTEGDEK
jgi:hypothetical protein